MGAVTDHDEHAQRAVPHAVVLRNVGFCWTGRFV
jgi:hypothetical protein